MTLRPYPRSLAGQMVLLVALALALAQAINFGLAMRERDQFRRDQTTRPAAIRIADALDRERAGRPIGSDRGRVRRAPANPILATMQPQHDLAAELRRQLAEQGVPTRDVAIAIAHHGEFALPDDPIGRRMARRRHNSDVIVIAVQQPTGDWLTIAGLWPRDDARIVWRLIGQTLILYGIVLLPVLWIARRISRPLKELAVAARGYSPANPPDPMEPHGPADVQAVIAAFNALSLRVTAMLDEKDRMLGAIGHDLRTPLAALRVRIESVEDDQDRTRMAETVAEMNRTLDDILSLARLGRSSEPATQVDVAALVDAVVEDFRDLGRNVSFEEPARVAMTLRPSLVRRAVMNLIENAVKYAGAAEVTLVPGERHVAICVADRGPGIPEDRLGDVFVPFTRLETSRNRGTGGIGLGLALARAIVEEARGTLTLANRDGGGLIATITLPRLDATA
ncbi:signal protein [Sphingomonas sp. Leaf412]|uniref:sensor histidine kinase n=1 Tax=Sphingomonas sp. Leaf412 TaxID=1736370 RepID=UPI0006FFD4B7|nr:ATP-binding protein [Sphingomonas sp. Leaf412]KQT33555.1 signal protein [Sphingomonas sp. Leaf412]